MPQWNGKTRGNRWGYMFFIGLIRHVGINAAYVFLCFVTAYFVIFARKASRVSYNFARKGLGYPPLKAWWLMVRNFYRFGQILIDKVAITGGLADKYNFCFSNYDNFLKVLDSDTGVVLMGAHVGNWETGAPFFGKYGKKIHIVIYDAEYRAIKNLLDDNKHIACDYNMIPVNNDSLSHVFLISDALNRHEYVCFQGDRYVNEDKLLYAPFLGRQAAFPAGPFILASRMRVPVVFYFAMREKNRTYRFHFRIISPQDMPRSRHGEMFLLKEYISTLEKIIGTYPEQWFNYYDFWETPS